MDLFRLMPPSAGGKIGYYEFLASILKDGKWQVPWNALLMEG